ncbi:MAG TPA: ferritin-like domain-containing protein [Alloacidobacterium sp.]|nr:ferritin-like domain-containing protein [Alloacidobacterium sp.]
MDKFGERFSSISRRSFLAGAGASAGATAVVLATGCGGGHHSNPTPNPTPTLTDADYLNFALNLEYLEAEFYLRAATGAGLSDADVGSNAGAVSGGTQVAFKTPAIQQYAMEIANDELAHVRFLRKALGSAAVSRPAIDLTNSFNAAAMAAGIGASFNPFADENSFLVGAFTFEDVGVTAYHGAAGLLTDKNNLAAAAGILATEAYHAGEIRTLITQLGDPYVTFANQISTLRATAGGGAETMLSGNGIVAADSNSISYDRTPSQVLHIVYLNAMAGTVSSGGFFPSGLNGTIKATVS